MADQFMARCGLDCEVCTYQESTGCAGCQATEGKLFWGECEVAKCCIAKGHDHCGQCKEFPCARLNEWAYEGEHSDNGKRILHLRAWNEVGYDAWRREQKKQ